MHVHYASEETLDRWASNAQGYSEETLDLNDRVTHLLGVERPLSPKGHYQPGFKQLARLSQLPGSEPLKRGLSLDGFISLLKTELQELVLKVCPAASLHLLVFRSE